jgi:hypothetical protein
MIIHDFDQDGNQDILANQVFEGTVTLYTSPGGALTEPWQPSIIASGMKSSSDMWLVDMDEDNQAPVRLRSICS